MQIQIDPSVPTNIPPGQLDDFKGFLDTVMDTIIGTSGPTLLSTGQTLWTGLAAIMVVWTGVRIALSGNFQPWEVIKLIIGLWIPWAMLNFYATPLPPPADAFTFPGGDRGRRQLADGFFHSRHQYRHANRIIHHDQQSLDRQFTRRGTPTTFMT